MYIDITFRREKIETTSFLLKLANDHFSNQSHRLRVI